MSHYQFRPQQAHESVWIAAGAVVVGDVKLAEGVSIWFNAVLRGDTERLTIAARSNIQDLCMVHADPGFPVRVGMDVTVGHHAIIHGAQIGSRVLIGMGAILLNGVQVGDESIVGAGALLTQGKTYPPRSLILGSPARVVREITDSDLLQIQASAQHYVGKARAYRGG